MTSLSHPITCFANTGVALTVDALFYGNNCDMIKCAAEVVPVKMIEAVRGLALAAAA
jgi:hypothetical protein